MSSPIYLIGARGCGKTTIGQALAQAMGFLFCDTDHHLYETTGKTVAEMVSEEGWQGFRQHESESLIAVTAPDRVIATGGGMILAEKNRQFMREQGTVIYLYAPAEVLAGRLEISPEDAQRPTLTGRPIAEEMADILAERDDIYRQTAHHVVDASQPPEVVARQICNFSHTN